MGGECEHWKGCETIRGLLFTNYGWMIPGAKWVVQRVLRVLLTL